MKRNIICAIQLWKTIVNMRTKDRRKMIDTQGNIHTLDCPSFQRIEGRRKLRRGN